MCVFYLFFFTDTTPTEIYTYVHLLSLHSALPISRVVLMKAGRWSDRVGVRMLAGQHPADWARRTDALAHAFGARSCLVGEIPTRPGYLALTEIGRAHV